MEIPMSVVRTVRYTSDADVTEIVRRRAALLTAVRAAFPGLLEARLTKAADGTWADSWLWSSREAADAAISAAPTLPETGAAFSIVRVTGEEFADLIDQR
jgi:hypothetical protein